ncbi:MAG: DedA family protein [Bacteroidota bacterium]
MPSELIKFITEYGYYAIFILIFLQEIGVPNPIPSEAILIFSGYLIFNGILSFPFVFLVVVLADFMGTNLLFFIFYFFGLYIIQHKPKWIPISEKTIVKFSKKISKGGLWTVFIGRLTPYLRGYTSVFTGLLHIEPRKFLPIALLSAVTWCIVCLSIGIILGPSYNSSVHTYENTKYILAIFIASVFVIIFSLNFFRKKRVIKHG